MEIMFICIDKYSIRNWAGYFTFFIVAGKSFGQYSFITWGSDPEPRRFGGRWPPPGLTREGSDPVRGAGSSPGAGTGPPPMRPVRSDGRRARAAPPGPGDLRSEAWPFLRAKGRGGRWIAGTLGSIRGLTGRLRERPSVDSRRSPCQRQSRGAPEDLPHRRGRARFAGRRSGAGAARLRRPFRFRPQDPARPPSRHAGPSRK